jgi:hypothetical protein
MNFNLEKMAELSGRMIDTLRRFPMATLSAFLLTIIVISLIELDFYKQESNIVILAIKVAFVSSLGITLFPALRLLHPNSLLTFFGVVVLIGYYYILPTNISDGESNLFFRHTLLNLSLFLMLIWAPFVSIKISNKNIWEWTQNIILALLATVVLSSILFAGLSLAIYSIERLFEINIPSRRYIQLGIMVFGLYGVNFFLSQMPKYILLVQVRTYTKVEVIFTKYILTSLAIGYFLILFAYDIKIFIGMEFPKGVLAWITIAFSVVAISTYLFWTPLWKEKDDKYGRYIWIAVLIQTFMLGSSIWIRVDEYGFTESRYFISLFGVWLLLMSLYFILIRSASYKWLFITLSLFIIASQFGKYSASNVSREDQMWRLYHIIEDNQPISDKLDIKTKYKISNLIEYLYNSHGKNSLSPIIPDIVQKHNIHLNDINSTTNYNTIKHFPYFATKELGFKFVNHWEWKYYLGNNSIQSNEIHFKSSKSQERVYNIDGYQWLLDLYYSKYTGEKVNVIKRENDMSFLFKGNSLNIKEGNSTLAKIDLNDFIRLLNEENNTRISYMNEPIISNKMEHLYENKKVKVKLLINSLYLLNDGNISSLSGRILLKVHSKN